MLIFKTVSFLSIIIDLSFYFLCDGNFKLTCGAGIPSNFRFNLDYECTLYNVHLDFFLAIYSPLIFFGPVIFQAFKLIQQY